MGDFCFSFQYVKKVQAGVIVNIQPGAGNKNKNFTDGKKPEPALAVQCVVHDRPDRFFS